MNEIAWLLDVANTIKMPFAAALDSQHCIRSSRVCTVRSA